MKLFCFGIGYVAKHLDPEATGSWRGENGELTFDPQALQESTHILISIPPNENGDIVIQEYGGIISGLKNVQWIGYLSSTSVYGDQQGGYVDETTPCMPISQRAVNRYKAEQQWLALGVPIHIFRLSGIYGPGRSVFDSLTVRINKPGHVFSRIHIDDIVQVLKASMKNPNAGSIYNLADDLPAESRDVIEFACGLARKPYPPLIEFENAELSPMAKSFYMEYRRVKNDKIKNELGINLKFPTFREGLMDIFRNQSN